MNRWERVGLILFITGLYVSLVERFDPMITIPLANDTPIIAIPIIAIGVIIFILY